MKQAVSCCCRIGLHTVKHPYVPFLGISLTRFCPLSYLNFVSCIVYLTDMYNAFFSMVALER